MFNKGFGITTVSRELDIPKSTLYYWRCGIYRPPSARWYPEPSNELAYVIGVMLGDGSLKRHSRDYDIKLNTIDIEFAETFSNMLAKLLNRKVLRPKYIGRKRGRNYGWEIAYSSKAFYTWFKRQSLETLKKYIEYDKDTVKYFLRGLYDSEGSNYKCRRISLCNSDLDLLQYTQYLLKRYFGIRAIGPYIQKRAGSIMIRNGRRYRRKVDVYILEICRKRDVQAFLIKIGFSIREKQLGLPRRGK